MSFKKIQKIFNLQKAKIANKNLIRKKAQLFYPIITQIKNQKKKKKYKVFISDSLVGFLANVYFSSENVRSTTNPKNTFACLKKAQNRKMICSI